MNKKIFFGFIFTGIILISVLGFFFIKNISNGNFYNEVSSDIPNNYTWESTTIFHKDFKALLKSDWTEIETLASPTASIYAYLPPGTNETDTNAEAITVVISYVGNNPDYTLEGLLEQGVEISKQIMPDFNLTNVQDWQNNYFSGKKLEYIGTSENIKRNFVQVAAIKFDQLYAVTYSCPVGNCNSDEIYNYFIETFEPVEAKKNN